MLAFLLASLWELNRQAKLPVAASNPAMPSKATRQHCLLALVAAASIAPTALWALPIEQIPNPRQIKGNWVSDVANILKPETEQQLNRLINQLQSTNGNEIAVVTLPDSTPFSTPKELATKLFNTWGIGQRGKDNGLLFLVSLGDRRVEIETGYGVEAILPDAKVGRIIAQRVTPAFKQRRFDAGILAGTEALVLTLQGKPLGPVATLDVRSAVEAQPQQRLGSLNATATNSGLVQDQIGHNSSLSTPSYPWDNFFLIGYSLIPLFISAAIFYYSPRSASRANGFAANLSGIVGWILVRGLGQSVKLTPRQSSRKYASHLRFETVGVMRCATCGGVLEPVDDQAVQHLLKPTEKAAAALGSLQFRGWRCSRCAPAAMHLRGYESTSPNFDYCPNCHELTVINEDPYIIPSTLPPGPDLRIFNKYCVNGNYHNQQTKVVQTSAVGSAWAASNMDCGGGGFDGGGDFGGGSSGGGGAGGDW